MDDGLGTATVSIKLKQNLGNKNLNKSVSNKASRTESTSVSPLATRLSRSTATSGDGCRNPAAK